MSYLYLDDNDLSTFLSSLELIGEMSEIDLYDDVELHYAIANIIGDIRSQVPADIIAGPKESRKRMDVSLLLETKYEDWEEDRKEDLSIKPASQAIYDLLDLHDLNAYKYSIGDNNTSGAAIYNFEEAVDYQTAWTKYEIQLCALNDKEIDNLTLEDMVSGIISGI